MTKAFAEVETGKIGHVVGVDWETISRIGVDITRSVKPKGDFIISVKDALQFGALGIEGWPGERAVENRLWNLAEDLLPGLEITPTPRA